MKQPPYREKEQQYPYLHPDPVNIEIHACMDDEGDMDMDVDRYWRERHYVETCPKWLQECHRLGDLGFGIWPDAPEKIP